MTIVHCPCGTGCADCYGTLYCGCPDCYVPPEVKKRKKLKVKKSSVEFEKGPKGELAYKLQLKETESYELEKCLVTAHTKEWGKVIVTTPQVQTAGNKAERRRSEIVLRNAQPIKNNPKPPRPKSLGFLLESKIGPPKHTRYFCRTCRLDICNPCFMKTKCAGHNIQYLGSSRFYCESPFHPVE